METIRRRLRRVLPEERTAILTALLAKDSGNFGFDTVAALQKQSRSVFGHWFGEELSYREILTKVARSECPLKAVTSHDSMTVLEDRIAESVFNRYVESLSPEARAEFNEKLKEFRDGFLRDESGLGGLGGGLLAAQLAAQASGFGVYMMASSVAAGLSHAIGLTLPFAAFAGMSSLISWVIGPIGIAISVGLIAHQLFRNDFSHSAAAIFYFAKIRHRTTTILAISLGDQSPRNWFQQIERCDSLWAVFSLRDELNEHQDCLRALDGFAIVSGLSELLCVPTAACHGLEEALGNALRTKAAEELDQISECAATQFERLRPDGVFDVLTRIDKSLPGAAAACYAGAPQDSETHYASVMLLATRLTTN